MGIDLQWEGEKGDVLGRLPDEHDVVEQIIAASKEEKTACLRFIDPYGDTVFNQFQITVLLEELRDVRLDALGEEGRLHRQKLEELAVKAQSKVHTYLKFYGD
jgi:hypothetical protein